MTEESKNEETLRIEISHFASPTNKPRERPSKKDFKDLNLEDNSMKISIERKSSKKSGSINVNVNEVPTELGGSSDNIQIKIEKNKRKESGTVSVAGSPNPRRRKTVADDNSSSQGFNLEPLPTAKTERCDALGNVIRKGRGKKQRVTFQDILSKKNDLIKYVNIQSYKAYNVDISQMHYGGHEKTKSCCGGLCSIY